MLLLKAFRVAAVPASVRIGLIYLVLASVWIWGSDWLALQLLGEPAAVTQAQSLKGELFVLFTAALLFWLIGRHVLDLSTCFTLLWSVLLFLFGSLQFG